MCEVCYYFDETDHQAYTHELEIKVSHLEEENERLRKQKVSFSTGYFFEIHVFYSSIIISLVV